tara:strand:+ start:3131 stop:3586 length:456 start_codon:yes stop_codon:yes gene_type:complete
MANKDNPFSSYYNYPKAYGEAPPEERWHSDKSEPGMIPPWLRNAFSRKDQFGHGSPQPIVDTKEIMKKAGEILDEVYASGQINQDEFKQLYSTVQKEAMKIDPNVELAHKASQGETGLLGKIKKGLHDYADRQSTIDYYDVWSGEWKQAER